jgi:uncharacterized surface protein with fasciclin (FAS1) repeats
MRKHVAAFAACSVLFLAACGSDDSTSDTTVAAETTAAPETTMAATDNIVEVAQANADFTTLVAAVVAADLATTLSGTGPFTVFAPTDAAFEALPAGILEKLLLPKNKAVLAKILTYHVVAGKVLSTDLTETEVATVEGSKVAITLTDGAKVNGATVTTADVMASNGVIHVIDKVLIPASVDVAAL